MENLPALTAAEISASLQPLTEGLYYQSESDCPLEVVKFKKNSADSLTKEEVLTLTGNSAQEPVTEINTTDFFRKVVKADSLTASNMNFTDQMAALQAICEQQLQNAKVYQIGKRTITVLLLGLTSDGYLAGLKTTSIET